MRKTGSKENNIQEGPQNLTNSIERIGISRERERFNIEHLSGLTQIDGDVRSGKSKRTKIFLEYWGVVFFQMDKNNFHFNLKNPLFLTLRCGSYDHMPLGLLWWGNLSLLLRHFLKCTNDSMKKMLR